MNLPNKLTVLRMALVPVFVVFMFADGIANNYIIAFFIFIVASFTDMLDGQIARKNNLVTDFGKFMDPLADKILVMSAMLCLVQMKYVPAWVVIVILSREFLVTSLRLIAAGQGTVIAADKLGKYKTVCQMAWLGLALISAWVYDIGVGSVQLADTMLMLCNGLMWLSLILTVVSGVNYVVKNKNCISTMK
ncbi:MAG: CDP-diacylglycerol--glycerol-3-phosphate 3-phosphatidyltransferase [Hydrogenoanaerobacterium sp.]